MYFCTFAIVLFSALSVLFSPLIIIDAFREGRIALAIFEIIIAILLSALMIVIFQIREKCGNFEMDICYDDEPESHDLKNAAGYILAAVIILIIIMWFCSLGGII